MNYSRVRLNLIDDLQIDHLELGKGYVFFRIECDGYNTRANICDDISKLSGIVSVKNCGDQSTMFIMAKRNEVNETKVFSEIQSNSVYGQDCVIRSAASKDIDEKNMLQLLLNSLHRPNKDGSITSISGRFFHIHEVKDYDDSNESQEIVTLELLFDDTSIGQTNRLCLTNHVVTFTNIREKHRMHFARRRPFESFPQYVRAKHGLARASKSENDPTFIIKKANQKKNRINYLDFSEVEELDGTKSGIIYKIIELFNYYYEGVASIKFGSVEVSTVNRALDSKMSEYYQKRALTILSQKPVIIANREFKDGEATTKDLADHMKTLGLKPDLNRKTGLDCFKINIVHETKHFRDDPEHDTYDNDAYNTTQHVTIESFKGKKRKHIAEVIIEELSLKDDISHGQMTLYDWESKKYMGSFVFAIPLPDEDNEIHCRYATLTVAPNGKMTFATYDLDDDPLSMELHSAALDKGVECVIMDFRGNINVIRKTNMITMVDIEKLRKKLKANQKAELGTTGLRTEKGRMEYLPECIDINTLRVSNDSLLYFVGVVGKGMNTNIENAANVREVAVVSGSKLFFEEIVDLMAVPFVRHDQTTALPFPIKYLREWAEMNRYV